MTPEAQRIAIAVACGWKNHDHPDVMQFKQGWTMPEQWCMDPKGVLRFNHERPNYLNDLNAMHEAENFLFPVEISDLYSPDLVKEYASYLPHICIGHPGGAMRATAAQRAEAFLRTIGKWEESK